MVHTLSTGSMPDSERTREAFLVRPGNPFQADAPAKALANGRPGKGQLCMLPLKAAPIPSLPETCLPRFNAAMYGQVSFVCALLAGVHKVE